MPPDANDQGENVEKSEEQTTFESRDTEESHESYETSTALPAYVEVEVSSHESEKSQLSVSTKADLVDKNSEEIKNELKCLRETLDQFVAKKTSSEETREHYKSLEMQMLRSENIIGENSKLRLQIEALEESLKEREAESTDTVERLQQKIAELQKELCAISSDAQIHTKALEEATRNLAEHVENSATEKGALLQQIDSLRAELEETRAKLLEKKAMLEALKDEFDVERRALTHERQKIHNSRGDLANQILELSMSNNSLKETIVEYETKIDSLENFLLPESEAQLEKALSQLRFFEENESKLHDQSSFYRQRIDELTHELTMARREQEQEREHFQQLNHDSSKAYEQIQKTIVEKDEIIERLTTKLEETSKASSVEKAKLKKMTHELQVVRSNMDTKTCELEELLRGVKSQLESSTKENKELEVKLSVALEEMKENAAFKKEVLTRSDATSAANQVLTQRIEQLMRELQRTKTEFDETKTRLATFDQREAELFTKLQESDRVRRGLHNRVMQLSGNIRVYVRVRPTIPGEENRGTETPSGNKKRKHVDMTSSTIFSYPGIGGNEALKSSLGADDPTKNILEVQEPWTDRGGLSERRKKWKFGFDNVFTPSHDQNDIWEATKPLVQSAIDGYNVTIFAYGQTGSGKTYTMLGEPDHEGIVARSVKMLFSGKGSIVELSRGKSQAEISVELLEVYNEKVRDLLDTGKPDDKGLKVKANQAVGSTLLQVSCEEEVIEILRTAQARRCVKATASNAVSSRSHMLFTLHFKVTSDVGHTRVGKLNVCDLAGSERLGKSNANEIVGVSRITGDSLCGSAFATKLMHFFSYREPYWQKLNTSTRRLASFQTSLRSSNREIQTYHTANQSLHISFRIVSGGTRKHSLLYAATHCSLIFTKASAAYDSRRRSTKST